jgi:pre-mRNA 3'-end-processing factor FIP1
MCPSHGPAQSCHLAQLIIFSTSRYNDIRNIPQRSASNDTVTKPAAIKKEAAAKATPPVSGSDLPGISTSKIDVDAKPIYEPAGKPITQVNIDEGKLFSLFS